MSNQMLKEQIEHKSSVISDIDNVIKAVSQKIIDDRVPVDMEPITIKALASLVKARTSMNYDPFSCIDLFNFDMRGNTMGADEIKELGQE